MLDRGSRLIAPVAQLERAPGFEPVGRRFESCRARQWLSLTGNNGPVAQLVEQLTLNQLVQGSNPCRPTREIKGLTQIGLGPFFLGTFYIIPIPYNNWNPNTSQMGAKAVKLAFEGIQFLLGSHSSGLFALISLERTGQI